jgi:hypothetical protein
MHFMNESLRFFSSIVLSGALALGCVAGTTAPSEEGPVGMTTEALSGSNVGQQIVGTWHDSTNAFPTLDLKSDGSYTYNTGIVCITTPCPSGDTGDWLLLRSGSLYYVATVSTDDDVRWYRVGFDGQTPGHLYGTFGTTGTLVKKTYCVEWQTADEHGAPLTAFYAQNVKTYQESQDILAPIAPYYANQAIHEGTCASQPKICTTLYKPVCGQLFSGPEDTYSNVCGLKVAIRGAAGDSGFAKGRWNAGACH